MSMIEIVCGTYIQMIHILQDMIPPNIHNSIIVIGEWYCGSGIKISTFFKSLMQHHQSTHREYFITLLRSITMLCGTDNIPWNIPHNIVMDLNSVMFKTSRMKCSLCG